MGDGAFFEQPEGRFFYRVWGNAGPLVHFSHATGMTAGTYGPLAEILAGRFRVFAMDHRGHGKTEAEADPAKLKNWYGLCRDMERFFEFLGEPVIAAGHSLGAVVSLMAAARRPELVKALVLVDPTILPFSWMWWWYLAKKTGLARYVPIAYRAGKRKAVWPDQRTMLEAYERKESFRAWKDGFLESYIAGGTRSAAGGLVQLACDPAWESRVFATCPHDIWKYVSRITQPVMIIYGEESDTFLLPAVKRFKHKVPAAEMLCLRGATHFVPMERPGEVAEAIERFVS